MMDDKKEKTDSTKSANRLITGRSIESIKIATRRVISERDITLSFLSFKLF